MTSESSPKSESTQHSFSIALRNFLVGAFLSGVPIFAYLFLSVDMTYGSLAAAGTGRLIGAIAVPLFCGLLAAIYGQRVIKVLSSLLESVNLPF